MFAISWYVRPSNRCLRIIMVVLVLSKALWRASRSLSCLPPRWFQQRQQMPSGEEVFTSPHILHSCVCGDIVRLQEKQIWSGELVFLSWHILHILLNVLIVLSFLSRNISATVRSIWKYVPDSVFYQYWILFSPYVYYTIVWVHVNLTHRNKH